MATFKTQMNICVETQINKLLKKIADTYNIPLKNLTQMWDPSSSPNLVTDEETDEENLIAEEEKKRKLDKAKQYTKCQYVFTRGKRKGQMCGARACKNFMYCSKHKKHANKKAKKQKLIPEKMRTNILKRIRSINKYYHPDSGMVFKSKEEKVVIGKYVNGEVIDLNNDDLEICKKFCFKVELHSEEKRKENKINAVTEATKIKEDVENAILDSNKDAKDIADFLEILQINNDSEESDGEILEEEED